MSVQISITKLARGDGLWELLYADNVVLIAESKEKSD